VPYCALLLKSGGRLRENDIRQPPANDTAAQVNCEATA
jgi:hypothetical protein